METAEITFMVKEDHNAVWRKCLEHIKENVSSLTYNTWFIPIKPISKTDNELKVEVPNSFFIEWIEEHYCFLIKETIHKIIGDEAEISYKVSESQEEIAEHVEIYSKNISATIVEQKPEHESYINPKYTFENFIKGDNNQLARAAAVAISTSPGETSFNPFFVYGGVGLGKTHLLHAIGNKINEKYKNKKIIYLSSDAFTMEFVEAIQNNKLNEFSTFYRKMDVLIIDDIQFLVGKDKTQEHFFHIFNELHQAEKQIILSSDKPPKELKGLNERLTSRFQWGLQADIQPPDFETRIAILKNKCDNFGIFNLNNEIIEFIAYNITSNIRELEGCLVKLLANSNFSSKEIDMEMARKTVRDISSNRKMNVSIDYITKIVCEHYCVEENRVREKNRRKEVVVARMVAMYLSKIMTKSSLKTIGLHFGGRDHSTVIHAINSIEEDVLNDLKLKDSIDTIKSKIELGAF